MFFIEHMLFKLDSMIVSCPNTFLAIVGTGLDILERDRVKV